MATQALDKPLPKKVVKTGVMTITGPRQLTRERAKELEDFWNVMAWIGVLTAITAGTASAAVWFFPFSVVSLIVTLLALGGWIMAVDGWGTYQSINKDLKNHPAGQSVILTRLPGGVKLEPWEQGRVIKSDIFEGDDSETVSNSFEYQEKLKAKAEAYNQELQSKGVLGKDPSLANPLFEALAKNA